MLLPAVTEYGLNDALPRYAEAARAIGVAEPEDADQVAGARLLDELRALNRDLAVPTPREYGVAPDAWERLLPTMAAQALASGSPANNPRVPDEAEIVSLYRRVFA
jgi:alcohol dehydrogenase class IV